MTHSVLFHSPTTDLVGLETPSGLGYYYGMSKSEYIKYYGRFKII